MQYRPQAVQVWAIDVLQLLTGRNSIIRSVEQVKGFGPDLKTCLFRDADVLEKRSVHIKEHGSI